MTKRAADSQLAERACRQHGLISRAQALASGLNDQNLLDRLRAGDLLLVSPGVYRYRGVAESWRGDVMAACLFAGPAAVASHSTAAVLHRLDGFAPGRVELTIPRRTRRHLDGVRLHRPRLGVSAAECTVIDGIPTTALERTLIDVTRVRGLRRGEIALDGAQRDGTAHVDAVAGLADRIRGRGRTRIGKYSDLVSARLGHSQPTTALERRFVELIGDSTLPRPECQVRMLLSNGRAVTADFVFPASMVVVEVDGRVGHAGDLDRQRDAERDSLLQLSGFRVLRFTYRDVDDRPGWVVATVQRAIRGVA
jgi:predicted transcriptional regulator of viral defense system